MIETDCSSATRSYIPSFRVGLLSSKNECFYTERKDAKSLRR